MSNNLFMKTVRILILTLLTLLALPTVPQAGQAGGEQITPGEPLRDGVVTTATLAGRQTVLHKIRLAAGEFVRLKVLQKEANVALALLGPDDKVLVDVDMEEDLNRAELLSWIAAGEGEYSLRVSSGLNNENFGRYQVEVITRDSHREQSGNLIEAQSAAMSGLHALRKGINRKNVTDAIQHFEKSLPLWQAAGDKNAEARTLIIIGEYSRRLGDRARSRGAFERALSLRQEIRDRWGEAEALNDLAIIYDETGEKQRAIDLHKLALPIRHESGNLKGEITTLLNMAKTYFDLDELSLVQDLLKDTRAALDRAKANTGGGGDQSGEAEYASKHGLIYDRLGQSQQALSWFEKALSIIRAIPKYAENADYVVAEATYLNNIAKAYSGMGDKVKALEYYKQALEKCGPDCPPYKKADFNNNIGKVSLALGDLAGARAALEGALNLRGNDPTYEAYTHIGLGDLAYLTKDLPKARDEFGKAAGMARKVGVRHVLVAALDGAARVELADGKEEAAEKAIEEGLAGVAELSTRVVNPDLRASYLAATQRLYDHKLNLLMRRHDRRPADGLDAEAFALCESARARGLLDLLQEARVDIRREVDPALVRRERGLFQRLSGKNDYLTSLRILRERFVAAGAQPEVAKVDKEISLQEQEVNEIRLDLERTQAEIRRGNGRYAELTRPRQLGVKEVQSEILDAQTMLLEYRLTDERSYLFAITSTDFYVYPLPGRAGVDKAALDVYRALTARGEKIDFEPADERERRIREADAKFNELAPALSRMLLGKVAGLSTKKRLLIVADGMLQYFPFAALPVPSRPAGGKTNYLVGQHEIVYLPSASALLLIRTGVSRSEPDKKLAVVADPIYQPKALPNTNAGSTRQDRTPATLGAGESPLILGVEPLQYARKEAKSVLGLVRESDRAEFLSENATKRAATSDELARYRIIHYAVHGRFDAGQPSQSGLIFSLFDENGAPVKDGSVMTLADAYNLKLSADLVTLSGCQTALGQEVRGEGVVGLTRGFTYAGARRVLASLWIVNDEATSVLMKSFYTNLLSKGKGQTTSAALRAAQESLAGRPPYYWAGFILQGEW